MFYDTHCVVRALLSTCKNFLDRLREWYIRLSCGAGDGNGSSEN